MKCLMQSLLTVLVCTLMVGCPPPSETPADTTDDSGTGTGGDMSATALNYSGTLSGSVASNSSTAGAQTPEAERPIPLAAKIGGATAWLTDMEGNPLLDANGQEYPEFAINTDGTFDLDNLPVGVSFMVNIDLDGDGEADMFTFVHIPKDLEADAGALDGAMVDPLSTLTAAKLAELLAEHELDALDLALSLSGLIGRTRDAYENLFADAGIEGEISLNDILDLSPEELARLFAELIPLAAQRGMLMAESNIDLAIADDIEGIVKAAAKIMIDGGFAIADDPGGIDLSFLADSPHVEALTFEQFHEFMGMPDPGEPAPRGVPADFVQTARVPPGEPTIYVNTLAEPDRNFFAADDEEQPPMIKPLFGEHMLVDIAEFHMDGKTISLDDLHTLIGDVDIGLGARLTYTKPGGPDQPPVDVFETPDGTGVEKDTFAFFEQMQQLGFGGPPSPEEIAQQEEALRQILKEFLAGIAQPSFDRLFGGFLMERVPSAEEFARLIREQKAHVPFSRSGPSQWFVVADADPFQNPNAEAITVDVETDADGKVTKVMLNPGGDGKFYLGFGPMTEAGMETERIRRSNGKFLHSHHGEPQFLEMANTTIFQNVGGQSFFEAFSETGEHYPGAPALRLPNHEFDPSLPPDPETNPPDWEAFVLMTQPGPQGIPVRVDYADDGSCLYNPAGQYYLLFDERTDSAGLFGLISESGELLEQTPGDWETRVLVAATAVQGIDLAPETFTHVFGIEVPNPGYDPAGAPYYDDIDNNNVHDTGEPSFSELHFLFDPSDWRSTWVERYYRRADNNGFPDPEEIDWESETPALLNGVALVPRNVKPRLNAFRFGRPNTALNLLLAFSPPEFFNGTQSLGRNTRVNPFMAVAIIDLTFEQMMNVEATVDWDGPGGMPAHEELVPAWFFVAPIGDPIALIADGFKQFAE